MERLHDKMYNWETPPPAPVWDRIRAAMDESEMGANFPQRLAQAEATPPVHLWSEIEAKLQADNQTSDSPVISIHRKRNGWIRIAAAVLITAVSAWGIRSFVLHNNSTTVPTIETAFQPKKETPLAEPRPTNNLPALGAHAQDDSSNSSTLAKQNYNTSAASVAHENLKYASTANQDYADEYSKLLFDKESAELGIAEKYVTLLTPEGSFIRVSKKWSHLLCCIAGEDTTNPCHSQLKAWQEQLAESPVTPAPGGFMDILDLVSSVSESIQL